MNINDVKIKILFFEECKENMCDAIGTGVYEFLIGSTDTHKSPIHLYIGESFSMLQRCATHLFEIIKNPQYMGLTEQDLLNPNLQLVVKILEKVEIPNDYSNKDRDILLRSLEEKWIKIHKPVTQFENSDTVRTDCVDRVKKAIINIQ